MRVSSEPFCAVCATELTKKLASATNEQMSGYFGGTLGVSSTRIVDYAFAGATASQSAEASKSITNNVTWIGRYSFLRCTSLNEITIPDSVTYASHTAFYGCDNLKVHTTKAIFKPEIFAVFTAKRAVLTYGNGEDVFDVVKTKKSLLPN
jgi:hypothetical protein